MTIESMSLTDQQFDARRKQIEEQASAMQQRVNAYRDQQMAKLFVQSGWTQQRIAGKEGKSQNWVCYRLRFGRFLEFITTGDKLQNPPKNLTERRFRVYFERTSGSKEQPRFRQVIALMEQDFCISQGQRVGRRLLEHCGDGKCQGQR